jgi:hypothetical protein
MFEKASILKLRYKVKNGNVSTEDLWDLSLEDLNTLAKSLNKQIKDAGEENFIEVKSKANTALDLAFEITKHVISVKLAEQEKKKISAEKRQKRAQLLELISQKENEALSSKSLEELRAEFAAMED